jgi:hypothetical protein
MSYHFVPESNPLPVPTSQQLNVPTNLGQVFEWKDYGFTADQLKEAGNEVTTDPSRPPKVSEWKSYQRDIPSFFSWNFLKRPAGKPVAGSETRRPEFCVSYQPQPKDPIKGQLYGNRIKPEHQTTILCQELFYTDPTYYSEVLSAYYMWLDREKYLRGGSYTPKELKQQGRGQGTPYHPDSTGALSRRQSRTIGQLPQIPDSIVIGGALVGGFLLADMLKKRKTTGSTGIAKKAVEQQKFRREFGDKFIQNVMGK